MKQGMVDIVIIYQPSDEIHLTYSIIESYLGQEIFFSLTIFLRQHIFCYIEIN